MIHMMFPLLSNVWKYQKKRNVDLQSADMSGMGLGNDVVILLLDNDDEIGDVVNK